MIFRAPRLRKSIAASLQTRRDNARLRALLDLTQPQLAALAEIGLSSVVDFERSRRDVSRPIVLGLKVILEKAGVQFITKNSAGGAGVRLRN